MKLKLNFFLFLFLYSCSNLPAQPFSIAFQPVFNHMNVKCNETWFRLNQSDSIRFETFKFYISGIELLQNSQLVWKEEASFHLINAEEDNTLQVALSIPPGQKFNIVKFNLGIDSITNVSGAMGGDLDPTRGMYWTWQSGYINLKLEGNCNLSKSRNNEFQFHIGGYQFPNDAHQEIELKVPENKNAVIKIDLEKICKAIDFEKEDHIMMPSKSAVEFSKKIASGFIVSEK